ncbi:MAG: DUF1150 family protein [Pseudomonadota bacterium]
MTDTPKIDTMPDVPAEARIVYVREAEPEMLPEALKDAPGPFYSLHDEAGNMLAVAPNRPVAFALAKRNELRAVSVH